MYSYGMHGWGMALGWLIPVILIAMLVYAISSGKRRKDSVRDILDRRYASGEIDTKEYRERLKELGYPQGRDVSDEEQ